MSHNVSPAATSHVDSAAVSGSTRAATAVGGAGSDTAGGGMGGTVSARAGVAAAPAARTKATSRPTPRWTRRDTSGTDAGPGVVGVAQLRCDLPRKRPHELGPADPHHTGECLDDDIGRQVPLAEGGHDPLPVRQPCRQGPASDQHEEGCDADNEPGERESGGDPADGARGQPPRS